MIPFGFTIHPEGATEATAQDRSSKFYRKSSRRIEMLNGSGPWASKGSPASTQLLKQRNIWYSQTKTPVKPRFPTAFWTQAPLPFLCWLIMRPFLQHHRLPRDRATLSLQVHSMVIPREVFRWLPLTLISQTA